MAQVENYRETKTILEPDSQQFIFFIPFEWVKQARVLHYNRLEKLARDKCSSLFGPFVSYEDKAVL